MIVKSVATAFKVLSLTDLTRLKPDDNEQDITKFCHDMAFACRKFSPITYPAAICIYPKYIKTVSKTLSELNITSTQITTVINFPSGDDDMAQVIKQVQFVIDQEANEIDLVFPYKSYLSGDEIFAASMVSKCKEMCPDHIQLKVIIETGKLGVYQHIYNASRLVIDAGADFVKTSTGKVAVNATLAAAKAVLQAIKNSGNTSCGFKASGGINTVEEAEQYLILSEQLMGQSWIIPSHFRFGASSLLNDITTILTKNKSLK